MSDRRYPEQRPAALDEPGLERPDPCRGLREPVLQARGARLVGEKRRVAALACALGAEDEQVEPASMARVAVCGIRSAAGAVSESVTVTPLKPSCFRSSPLMIVLENAAGLFEPSSLG